MSCWCWLIHLFCVSESERVVVIIDKCPFCTHPYRPWPTDAGWLRCQVSLLSKHPSWVCAHLTLEKITSTLKQFFYIFHDIHSSVPTQLSCLTYIAKIADTHSSSLTSSSCECSYRLALFKIPTQSTFTWCVVYVQVDSSWCRFEPQSLIFRPPELTPQSYLIVCCIYSHVIVELMLICVFSSRTFPLLLYRLSWLTESFLSKLRKSRIHCLQRALVSLGNFEFQQQRLPSPVSSCLGEMPTWVFVSRRCVFSRLCCCCSFRVLLLNIS